MAYVRACRYTNGAFSVDMPRGCVTVMHEGGYAANGLKHCVRPMDMTGTPPQLASSCRLACSYAALVHGTLIMRESVCSKTRGRVEATCSASPVSACFFTRIHPSCYHLHMPVTCEARLARRLQLLRCREGTQARAPPSSCARFSRWQWRLPRRCTWRRRWAGCRTWTWLLSHDGCSPWRCLSQGLLLCSELSCALHRNTSCVCFQQPGHCCMQICMPTLFHSCSILAAQCDLPRAEQERRQRAYACDRQQQAERIKRQCWKVLDACIRQLERSNKHKPPQVALACLRRGSRRLLPLLAQPGANLLLAGTLRSCNRSYVLSMRSGHLSGGLTTSRAGRPSNCLSRSAGSIQKSNSWSRGLCGRWRFMPCATASLPTRYVTALACQELT